MTHRRIVVTALSILMLTAPEAALAAPTAATCRAAKLRAVAARVVAALKCEAAATTAGATEPDPACLDKAELKFLATFAKIDGTGVCTPSGDAASYEAAADDAGAAIVAEDLCAAQLRAAGKYAQQALKCHAAAARKGVPVDQGCVAKAASKLAAAFAGAAAHGCTKGDAAVVQTVIDEMIAAVQCRGFGTAGQCDPSGFECGPNGIVASSICTEDAVCATCPPGTQAVDLDGDGCEDTCNGCPAIGCTGKDPQHPLRPYDGDGDGCAETCPGADAIGGQCAGYDYAGQCDAAVLDCGARAILSDLDCDGSYDACVPCPADTEPVDRDGDGCEEACDACPEITCPSGDPLHPLAALDADGDGCRETCPCTDAVGGRCAGLAYSGSCAAGGTLCGGTTIPVDADCDGHYDLCAACPAGTEPVDRDGDGCPELCDCSESPLAARGPKVLKVDKEGDGVPLWVEGTLGTVGAVSDPTSAVAWNGPIRDALGGVAELLHLDPASLSVTSVFTDALGEHHLRLAHAIFGIPVLREALVVHVRDGTVYAVNGNARGDRPVSMEEAISSAQAVDLALAEVGKQGAVQQQDDVTRALYRHDGDLPLELGWFVHVVGLEPDQTPIDQYVLVSAANGAILWRENNVQTFRSRSVSDKMNTTGIPPFGTLIRSELDPPVTDPVVNTNFDYLGSVYDCFLTLFGRDSYNGIGGSLHSSVHYGVAYNNASWITIYHHMIYGDGDGSLYANLVGAYDLTAHEVTHGLTWSTSRLSYFGDESASVNESMSDIMGAVCEWHADGHVESRDTWLCGEDVYTPALGSDAIRYMADPANDGISLDRYDEDDFYIDPHYGSGVGNLAFQLLSDGGQHPRGMTTNVVPAIGIYAAAQIFYRANTTLLWSESGYEETRLATTQAAEQLYGDGAEKDAVVEAWRAVNVDWIDECHACLTDHQCGPNAFCQFGACATGNSRALGDDCCRDYQCTTGNCSIGGKCQCTSDSQCPSGEYCAIGFLGAGKNKCVPFKAECDPCVLSSQCTPGASCQLGRCATHNSVGLGGSCCRDHQCTTGSCNSDDVCQCTQDSQCPAGQRCALGFLGIGKNQCEPYFAECSGCVLTNQCAPIAFCDWFRCARPHFLPTGASCCRDIECINGNCKLNGHCN